MIYRMGAIQKELTYGSLKHKNTLLTLVGTGVFAGMLTFSVFFILQSLRRSVLADEAAFFMQESYHTTLLIYLVVSYLGFTLYDIIRFRAMTFNEIYYNIWYTPLHMGYRVQKLVFAKIAVQVGSVLVINTAGFLSTMMMSSVMKFPFVPDYIVSMYIMSCVNSVMLLLFAMTCSLLSRDISNARTLFGLSALIMVSVKVVTGFFAIATSRESLAPVSNLFTQSAYLYIAFALMGACLFVCVYKASTEGRRYHPSMAQDGAAVRLKKGLRLVVETERTDDSFMTGAKKDLERIYRPRRINGALSVCVTALLIVIVTFSLLVDAMVLVFAYASPEKETSVMGFIPYIFQSSTMEPQVRYNDIAFFEKIDRYVQIEENDVVLYKDDVMAVQVRRVLKKYYDPDDGDPMLEVDIDYYPDGSAKGLLHDYIDEDAPYGRLVGTNRWLGAIVLFANTMFGRVLFMLVPTVLIFFNRQISGAFTKRGKRPPADEKAA